MSAWRVIVAGMLPALLAGSGCSGPNTRCQVGTPALVFQLYFGMSIPNRAELTDSEWRQFLDTTVTPALPAGYTVLSAEGAWMSPRSRHTIREHTKVLVVALADAPSSWTAVDAVRTTYEVRYAQQMVGLTVSRSCVQF